MEKKKKIQLSQFCGSLMSWKSPLGCSHSNSFPSRLNRFVDYPQRCSEMLCTMREKFFLPSYCTRQLLFLCQERFTCKLVRLCRETCVNYSELQSRVFSSKLFVWIASRSKIHQQFNACKVRFPFCRFVLIMKLSSSFLYLVEGELFIVFVHSSQERIKQC